jgi:hypothetical protein
MKILFGVAALVVLCGLSGELHGQVILQFEAPQNLVGADGVEEDGYIFTSPKASQFVNGGGLSFRDPSPGLGNLNGLNTVPYNGSDYAVPFTSSEPVLQRADGSPFRLMSMDLAAYSASFSDTNTVEVTGYYATGGTVTTDLVFDGTVMGESSDFHTFVFDSRWTNLQRVVLFDAVPWASGVGFSIDNIAVSTVPEPEFLTPAGLFLLSLALRRRREARGRRAAVTGASTLLHPPSEPE